ncbi:MAG: sugar transferase [Chloroflexota bacterium]
MLDVETSVATTPLPIRTQVQATGLRRVLAWSLPVQDAVLIYGALVLAYWARFLVGLGPSETRALPFSAYQGLAGLLLIVMLPTLLAKGAYSRRINRGSMDEFGAVTSAATIAIATIIAITFMLHRLEYSRGVIVYLWIFLIADIVVGRMLFRSFRSLCNRRGWATRRLLVVGATDAGKIIMQAVKDRPDLGYEVAGFVDRRAASRAPDFGRFDRLGTIEDIPDLIAAGRIDDVVIALPGSAHEEVWPLIALCEQSNVGLKLVPDLFRVSLSRVQVDDIAGIPLLDVQERAFTRIEGVLKRVLDVVIGSAVLLASAPIIAILWVLIHLDSEGPAFLKQERVGRGGRHFTCWKLRTMCHGADSLLTVLGVQNEATGPLFKMRRDPRCTRVGRHMRRLSLDELPQIWNVVRGDMSLVGPRPPLPREVEHYEPWQWRRLETTPGITGIWQVSGRSHLSFDEMVMMDITYVDNWSLGLDMKILFRTVSAVLRARGAY